MIWLLLFTIVSGSGGSAFGVPQQFWVPEYLGKSGPIAFLMLGFSMGGFISGFNLYTYIMHGYRFPFIVTLQRPFQKFSINNALIPALFVLVYVICSAYAQYVMENFSAWSILGNLTSLLAGILIFQSVSYLYFTRTNTSAFNLHEAVSNDNEALADSPIHRHQSYRKAQRVQERWRVELYFTSWFRLAWARDGRYYSKETIEQVLRQNHINAAKFELVLFASFIILVCLSKWEWCVLPAAAGILLFATGFMMLYSALHSWLKGWTIGIALLVIGVFIAVYKPLMNLRTDSQAFGLNYDIPPVPYNALSVDADAATRARDFQTGLDMLNAWKKKQSAADKPKLVILNHSGGGSRSAYWTMCVLDHLDSLSKQSFYPQVFMMTGASGGMVGAAYYRDLKWKHPEVSSTSAYAENVAKDLLNPVISCAVINDWFIPFHHQEYGGRSYKYDRAAAWESALNRNTDFVFNTPIASFEQAERASEIPLMILSPTISNDGRRLLISTMGVSQLMTPSTMTHDSLWFAEDIDFQWLFRNHDAKNLSMSSALRMNAAFPMITPATALPSSPAIHMMDAGIRDNFGSKTSMQWIWTYREWIQENTSGVVILQIRDLPRNREAVEIKESLFGELFAPIGGVYGNMTKNQDYSTEQTNRYLSLGDSLPIEWISLELPQNHGKYVSLSWHLTSSEKKFIQQSIANPTVASRMQKLIQTLQIEKKS
ncbi:MAG: patatin-like phospholipase family protein [Flavobacteriales bacterium]